ncbi:MAG: hypothetical protein ABL309_11875 [Phycisphaerales bacterium]
MTGALTVAKRMPGGPNEAHTFLQSIARQIATTNDAGHPYIVPESAFGQTKSNLDPEEVKNLFADFAIRDPWTQMSQIADRIGLKAVHNLRDDFTNFALLRHQCAHDATTNIQPSDLQTMARVAVAISAAFDILLSAAVWLPLPAMKEGKHQKREIQDSIKIRFLIQSSSGWRDIKENGTRAAKVYPNLRQALKAKHAGFVTPNSQPQTVIIRDGSDDVEGWIPCIFSVVTRL